jgi:hypothetical protein
VGRGAGNVIFKSLGGPLERYSTLCGPSSDLKESFVFRNSKFIFLANEYEAAKLRWAEGAQRPVWRGNELKKKGARSARARTRGQNPLVSYISFLQLLKKKNNSALAEVSPKALVAQISERRD